MRLSKDGTRYRGGVVKSRSNKEMTGPRRSTLDSVLREIEVASHALFTHVLDDLPGTGEKSRFLEHALVLIAKSFRASGAYLCIYGKEHTSLCVEALYLQKTRAEKKACHGSGHDGRFMECDLLLWEQLHNMRRPVLLQNPPEQQSIPFRELIPDQASQVLLIPLRDQLEVLGLIVVMLRKSSSANPHQIQFAHLLSQQVVLGWQFGRLLEKERQRAVCEEKRRIAGDLHDTMAQTFTGIMMQVDLVEASLSQDPEESRRRIARVRQLGQTGLADSRRCVLALRSEAAISDCLANRLQELVTEFIHDTRIHTEFTLRGTLPQLQPEPVIQLVRITQEALTNIAKHAKCTDVRVQLASQPDSLQLTICDNGSGFDVCSASEKNGFGLIGMQERTRKIGGHFKVRGKPGRGTQIKVIVPFNASHLLDPAS